jgi:hypothetical protein
MSTEYVEPDANQRDSPLLERPLLESLLGTLNWLAIKSRYELQLIVVDGACSNSCMLVSQRQNAQWLQAMPCRGEQLRRGAAHARHPVLWFLHADAQLRGNPLELVSAATERGAVGGYFAFRFANTQCWQSRLLEALIGIRNRVGTPYGDQGIFVTAEAYESCGQHSPWPLFEEIELIRRLRRAPLSGVLARVSKLMRGGGSKTAGGPGRFKIVCWHWPTSWECRRRGLPSFIVRVRRRRIRMVYRRFA